MFNTPNHKVCSTRTDCFSENVYFTKKIQISVISIIKNHPSKLPFELLNIIEPLLVESVPDHGWINYQTRWDTWGIFARICVGSLWNHTGIIKGSKSNHISNLKGSQHFLTSNS